MSIKQWRNELCHCWKWIKYKRCCELLINKKPESFLERITKLPFWARIHSTNGAESSLKILSASRVENGVSTKLFNDEITLSTHKWDLKSESTNESIAIISFPKEKNIIPTIVTTGNGRVNNNSYIYAIKIRNDPRKLKIESQNWLFATIRIQNRKDCWFECFDIFFGESGWEEYIDENGIKQRPHLTIYPNGNNKFFRFVGYKCTLESNLEYNPEDKNIYPISSKVTLEEYSEQLILNFKFHKELNLIELTDIHFQENINFQ